MSCGETPPARNPPCDPAENVENELTATQPSGEDRLGLQFVEAATNPEQTRPDLRATRKCKFSRSSDLRLTSWTSARLKSADFAIARAFRRGDCGSRKRPWKFRR